MTKNLTIQSVASEMLNNLIVGTRENGKTFIHTKENIDWQTDIIHKAHNDMLPDDYIYQFINEALDLFAYEDRDYTNDDMWFETIYEIEGDIYTSDLTEWLASHNNRVYYLTEVLEEYGIKDGFQLLQYAQQKEKQEIARLVLEGIQDYINSQNENEV